MFCEKGNCYTSPNSRKKQLQRISYSVKFLSSSFGSFTKHSNFGFAPDTTRKPLGLIPQQKL